MAKELAEHRPNEWARTSPINGIIRVIDYPKEVYARDHSKTALRPFHRRSLAHLLRDSQANASLVPMGSRAISRNEYLSSWPPYLSFNRQSFCSNLQSFIHFQSFFFISQFALGFSGVPH